MKRPKQPSRGVQKVREGMRRIELETEEAREAGREYFKTDPDRMAADVLHEAHRRYGKVEDIHRYWGFYDGYRGAMAQRDEFLREKRREEEAVKIAIEWKRDAD